MTGQLRPDDGHLPTLADLAAALEQEANERLVPLPAPRRETYLPPPARPSQWLWLPGAARITRRGRRGR